MSGRKRRKKKTGAGTIFFLSLLIAAGCFVLLGLTNEAFAEKIKGLTIEKVQEKAEEKVAEQVLEQVVVQALESTGDPEAAKKAKEIVNNIDEEDKQKVVEMVGKYVNEDTLSDVKDMIDEGINGEAVSEIKEHLQESISDEDKEKLAELYEKYRQGF